MTWRSKWPLGFAPEFPQRSKRLPRFSPVPPEHSKLLPGLLQCRQSARHERWDVSWCCQSARNGRSGLPWCCQRDLKWPFEQQRLEDRPKLHSKLLFEECLLASTQKSVSSHSVAHCSFIDTHGITQVLMLAFCAWIVTGIVPHRWAASENIAKQDKS